MIIIFNLILACAHAVKVIYILAPMTRRTVSISQISDIIYHLALIIATGILHVKRREIVCCVRDCLPTLKEYMTRIFFLRFLVVQYV